MKEDKRRIDKTWRRKKRMQEVIIKETDENGEHKERREGKINRRGK